MPPLTLTVLGASTAAPNPGGACSGYLVRDGDDSALVDCGSGVAGRLAIHLPPHQLGGIAISHLHPDHYLDLVPLYYILRFGRHKPPGRIKVLVPPGGAAFVRQLGLLLGGQPDMLADVFDFADYQPGREFRLGRGSAEGALRFTFHPVRHYVPSHAMRIRGPGSATLAFSSDAGPCPELVEAARAADLFMCESALLDPAQDPQPERRGHTSAAEAGQIARQAGAQRLLVTHYVSGNGVDDPQRDAARRTFGGPVELAEEGKTYVVG
jgi:ribonuclease BN (tRNA processing enzyme)